MSVIYEHARTSERVFASPQVEDQVHLESGFNKNTSWNTPELNQ